MTLLKTTFFCFWCLYNETGDTMAKRFKSKKKKSMRFHIYFICFFVVLSFAFFLSYFSSFFSQGSVLTFMLNMNLFSSNNKSDNEQDIFDFLLDYTIGKQELVEDEYDGSLSPQEYTPDPTPEENKENPIIYLYNSHQGEEYGGDTLDSHDVVPTVMLASYRMREELNLLGLNTIVETNPITEVLTANGWNYASSYEASKLLMQDALEKNNTLKYFFDIHRDSIPYESSVVSYDNKTYAKILFVIGTDHENYEENLALAEKLNTILNQKVPNLTRGIIKKGGDGVNGIYNQDFSPNTLLFEIGGSYNKISEVTNTIHVLAESIKELIG